MTAKEMFEELGYNEYLHTQFYLEFHNDNTHQNIVFYLDREEYSMWNDKKNILVFGVDLNEAIQKQIEELGWN